MSLWQTATVERWTRWSAGLATLHLNLAEVPAFQAGQFFNLALTLPDSEREAAELKRVSRSYSVSSAPGEPLEFFLVEVPGGALTPALFTLEPGAELSLNPLPNGHFVLSRIPDARVLWLIATGTGLGPYVSMLRTPEPWHRFERIVVVHGVRQADHLAYREEFAALSAQHGDRLTHVPVVSREELAGAVSGRLTAALEDGRLEAAAGSAIDADAQVLLCGNPAMIRETRALLEARGLARNRPRKPGQITIEKYWG